MTKEQEIKQEYTEDAVKEDLKDQAPQDSESEAVKDAAAQNEENAAEESAKETDAKHAEEAKDKASDEKGGFKKKKKKKDPKDEKIAELTEQLQRRLAEFDNFRKRTEKEKSSMYQIGAKDVVEKLLPVIDNFERGLENADPEDPFVDGMNKIYKQMLSMLSGLGVEPIESVGKEFDSNLHNAVMHIEDEAFGENIVVEEFQKGYMFKDTVVRHSMVKVAN